MAVRGRTGEPAARFREVAGDAVATRMEKAQAELGRGKAPPGGGAVMGDGARRIRRRAGADQEGQADPVAREERRSRRIPARRGGVRSVGPGDGEGHPRFRARAEKAGLRLPLGAAHGGHRLRGGRAEQHGGARRVGCDRTARPVERAQGEQRLWVALGGGGPEVAESRPRVARSAVPPGEAQRAMRCRVTGFGHAGEAGARPGMAPRGGPAQPRDRLRACAVHDAQPVLGRRVPLHRHPQEDAIGLHVGIGEKVNHPGAARVVRARRRERREGAGRERQQQAGEARGGARHRPAPWSPA